MLWIGSTWVHNMKTDKELNDTHGILLKAGWRYLGCDEWRDYITDMKLTTSIAHKVETQRDSNQKLFHRLQLQQAKMTIKLKPREPRLIHWQDWMGIAQELRRQLKPFGLTVKTHGVSQKKGDFIRWTVSKTP